MALQQLFGRSAVGSVTAQAFFGGVRGEEPGLGPGRIGGGMHQVTGTASPGLRGGLPLDVIERGCDD